MIALALRCSKNHVVTRCEVLREQGLVEWSPGIGGSLRRPGTVETVRKSDAPLLSSTEWEAATAAPKPPVPAESVATASPESVDEFPVTSMLKRANLLALTEQEAAERAFVQAADERANGQPIFPEPLVAAAVHPEMEPGTIEIDGKVFHLVSPDVIAQMKAAAQGHVNQPDPNTGKPPRPENRTAKSKGQHGSAYGGPKKERSPAQKANDARFLAAGKEARERKQAEVAARKQARMASIMEAAGR